MKILRCVLGLALAPAASAAASDPDLHHLLNLHGTEMVLRAKFEVGGTNGVAVHRSHTHTHTHTNI